MMDATVRQMDSDRVDLQVKIHNLINEFREKYVFVENVNVSVERESISINYIGKEDYFFMVKVNIVL